MEFIFSENFNGGSILSVMFVTVCTFITWAFMAMDLDVFGVDWTSMQLNYTSRRSWGFWGFKIQILILF